MGEAFSAVNYGPALGRSIIALVLGLSVQTQSLDQNSSGLPEVLAHKEHFLKEHTGLDETINICLHLYFSVFRFWTGTALAINISDRLPFRPAMQALFWKRTPTMPIQHAPTIRSEFRGLKHCCCGKHHLAQWSLSYLAKVYLCIIIEISVHFLIFSN